MMVLRHLPFFIVAAEEEHFDRAASRLAIAQPALSRRIKAMEEELNVVLFERLPRGVRLSPAGRQLYEDTRQLLRGFQIATDRLQRLAQGTEGRLNVGISEVVVRTPTVLRVIRQFREKYPLIELAINRLASRRQIELLMSGALDVGFFHSAPTDPKDLHYEDLGYHSYMLAMPNDHPLKEREKIYLRDLADEPFAWIPRVDRPATYDHLMTACVTNGLSPKIVYDAKGGDDILSYACLGLAVGFVNAERVRERDDKSVIVREVADLKAKLRFRLAWRPTDQSGALDRFLAIARNKDA